MNGSQPSRTIRSRRQGGFTLVEIMVVVVILGMLAALVAPAVLGRQAEAQIELANTDIASIDAAVKLYMSRNQLRIPTMEDLTQEDERGQAWLEGGNFKDGEFIDPWKNPYQIVPIDGLKYDIVSWGPDGEEDTEDDVRKLKSRE